MVLYKKNHQLTNLNKCGKFHACIPNSTILALSRLAKRRYLKMLTDGQTDARVIGILLAHLRAFCSGELISTRGPEALS